MKRSIDEFVTDVPAVSSRHEGRRTSTLQSCTGTYNRGELGHMPQVFALACMHMFSFHVLYSSLVNETVIFDFYFILVVLI